MAKWAPERGAICILISINGRALIATHQYATVVEKLLVHRSIEPPRLIGFRLSCSVPLGTRISLCQSTETVRETPTGNDTCILRLFREDSIVQSSEKPVPDFPRLFGILVPSRAPKVEIGVREPPRARYRLNKPRL